MHCCLNEVLYYNWLWNIRITVGAVHTHARARAHTHIRSYTHTHSLGRIIPSPCAETSRIAINSKWKYGACPCASISCPKAWWSSLTRHYSCTNNSYREACERGEAGYIVGVTDAVTHVISHKITWATHDKGLNQLVVSEFCMRILYLLCMIIFPRNNCWWAYKYQLHTCPAGAQTKKYNSIEPYNDLHCRCIIVPN